MEYSTAKQGGWCSAMAAVAVFCGDSTRGDSIGLTIDVIFYSTFCGLGRATVLCIRVYHKKWNVPVTRKRVKRDRCRETRTTRERGKNAICSDPNRKEAHHIIITTRQAFDSKNSLTINETITATESQSSATRDLYTQNHNDLERLFAGIPSSRCGGDDGTNIPAGGDDGGGEQQQRRRCRRRVRRSNAFRVDAGRSGGRSRVLEPATSRREDGGEEEAGNGRVGLPHDRRKFGRISLLHLLSAPQRASRSANSNALL